MSRRRLTTRRWMALIAALACLLAVPRLARSPILPAAGVFAAVTAFILCNALAVSIFGLQCPACSRWTLRRLARHGGYYRCASCRWRGKRSRHGFGPLVDATGPGDAPRYTQRSEARPWEGFAVPDDLDGTTSGRLLRGKRSRGDRPSGR